MDPDNEFPNSARVIALVVVRATGGTEDQRREGEGRAGEGRTGEGRAGEQ